MKKYKKLLLNISAIGIIASPIAVVISCGSSSKPNPPAPQQITIDKNNYQKYSEYNDVTNTLTIKKEVTTISDIFQNGYLDPNSPDPAHPNYLPIKILNLSDGLKIIDNLAFSKAELTQLTIPNSVTTIGDNAFFSSTLSSLTLGNSVTTIGSGAFQFSLLTQLTIPNSVTTIGEYAFESAVNATTTNVTMPSAFNTQGQLDNIFPNGHDQITFVWT